LGISRFFAHDSSEAKSTPLALYQRCCEPWTYRKVLPVLLKRLECTDGNLVFHFMQQKRFWSSNSFVCLDLFTKIRSQGDFWSTRRKSEMCHVRRFSSTNGSRSTTSFKRFVARVRWRLIT
jgi:hypothetical protein